MMKMFSVENLDSAMQNFAEDDLSSLQKKVAFILGGICGLRASEALALLLQDVSFKVRGEKKTVDVTIKTKADERMLNLLCIDTFNLLKRSVERLQLKDGFFFPVINKQFGLVDLLMNTLT